MSKANILVVDDEAAARTALAALLEAEGYDVETAGDGFKAMGRLATFEPDLVLTDFKMPGMDGIELMTKLKEHEAELPVVVMTAFGAVETAVTAMQKGAADYLLKPLNMDRAAHRARQGARTDAAPARNLGPQKPTRRALQLRKYRRFVTGNATCFQVHSPDRTQPRDHPDHG